MGWGQGHKEEEEGDIGEGTGKVWRRRGRREGKTGWEVGGGGGGTKGGGGTTPPIRDVIIE